MSADAPDQAVPLWLGMDDTIATISTPPGRGAVALVRMSGARAQEIARRHVDHLPAEPRAATLCTVRDGKGFEIDRAIVTTFAAPRSFTGEDMVEISTHGGMVTPALVLAALVGSGAREALPGELTRRAVLNGRIDLVQAEAIGDLIDARSRSMHGIALRQLDGGLSRRIAAIRELVLNVEALIAYDIDFPEEDDGPMPRARVSESARELVEALEQLLATAPAGELVREGATVVIAGAPNAGKSSLFNAMLGVERAIVTEVPGTTRDAIEAVIDAGRWPIRLVDTAGLRESEDSIERMGIEISMRYLSSADLVLACGETDERVEEAASAVERATEAPVLRVRTKGDIGNSSIPLSVSAITGDGIRTLIEAIEGAIESSVESRYGGPVFDAPIITRERHRQSTSAALDEARAFVRVWDEGSLPAPVAAIHLRSAAHQLEELLGGIDVEEVFDRVFRTFCVGK